MVVGQRGGRTGAVEDGLCSGVSGGVSTSSTSRKKWTNLTPFIIALVVFTEIFFLGRLDLAKNAAIVKSWTGSFYSASSWLERDIAAVDFGSGILGLDPTEDSDTCQEWLEREDAFEHSRDFDKNPIYVSGTDKVTCAVGCKFGYDPSKKPDASFGYTQQAGTASVLRSMESAQYYAENNVAEARRKGYEVVMTTSLSSDVPVGYFSWSEYDIMAPLQPKTENALAAAFISNCAAGNFRLKALEALERANVTIDSYGSCHRNHDGKVEKVATLKHYKFSLAFENSNEEDYVTEKFFQSLVAGTIPVVIGAPNILDFAPSSGSVLHIRELKDVNEVGKTMQYLAKNPDAYNQSVRWKYEGPSDSFKALVDMAAVHSSCRLCIHLATKIREQEEESPSSYKRPCKCTRGSETVYHIYVRERGRFDMVSIFLRYGNLTLEGLNDAVLMKFKSLRHVPIWKQERPKSINGDELKLYRAYPLGMTQREALYTFKFRDNAAFRSHVESTPCAKFEVIFV